MKTTDSFFMSDKQEEQINTAREKRGNIWNLFITLWKNTFNFKGKTGRKEFWLSCVIEIVFMYLLLIPFAIIASILRSMEVDLEAFSTLFIIIELGITFLPLFSLYVRRANDVGLKKFDIFCIAVFIPVVPAMFMSLFPSDYNPSKKGLGLCLLGVMLGIGINIYSGFICTLCLNSIEKATPFVTVGLIISTISLIAGGIMQLKRLSK